MSTQSGLQDRKLNPLLQSWPPGAVLTQRRLNELGIYRQLANKYAQNGWIRKLGSGAYVRAGDTVDWRGGVYALQTQLGMTVHVGADTALTHLGLAHYIPLGLQPRITLISDRAEQLPAWFRNTSWNANPVHHSLGLFDVIPAEASARMDWRGLQVIMSSPERAIVEQLRLSNSNGEIDYALELMRGLTTLRPHVVQALLEACRSIKAKRLFLWAAEVADHLWMEQVSLRKINLGKGKRQLYRGGEFDAKYQITVPPREELPGV